MGFSALIFGSFWAYRSSPLAATAPKLRRKTHNFARRQSRNTARQSTKHLKIPTKIPQGTATCPRFAIHRKTLPRKQKTAINKTEILKMRALFLQNTEPRFWPPAQNGIFRKMRKSRPHGGCFPKTTAFAKRQAVPSAIATKALRPKTAYKIRFLHKRIVSLSNSQPNATKNINWLRCKADKPAVGKSLKDKSQSLFCAKSAKCSW